MFYNKRWFFYLTLYIMIAGLFFLVKSQSLLSGTLQNFFVSTIIFFVILIIISFLAAFICTGLIQYIYYVWCKIKKASIKKIFPKILWYLFTIFCYAAIFLIFLKLVEY